MMKWIQEVSQALDALGSSLPVACGGFLGALLSLRFLKPDASTSFRLLMLGGGFAASMMLTPGITYLLDIKTVNVLSGLAFLVGLYGMSLISEGNELIKSGALRELVFGRLKKKIDGGE